MDATPSLREQGLEALQQGNVDKAIDLLARAVMANDRDADTTALLGISYSQKGLHAQAKRALQTAVELQPQNPNFRYNLGVVLERAGDTQGAAIAWRDTLQLFPAHAQAKAKMEALGPQGHALLANAPKPPDPVGVPGAGAAPPPGGMPPPASGPPAFNPPPGGMPPAPPGMPPPPAMPPPSGPPMGGPPTYGGPPAGYAPPPAPGYPPPGSPASFPPPMPPSTGHYGGYGAPAVHAAPAMGSGEAFFRRLGAAIIDGLIVNLIGCAAALPFGFAVGFSRGAAGGQVTTGDEMNMRLIGTGIQLVINAIYFGGLYSWRGQSLGKMALGIRVIGPDGENPSFLRGALRDTFGKLISGLVCGLGYFWMLWDADQQTWHDKIAGTMVERA